MAGVRKNLDSRGQLLKTRKEVKNLEEKKIKCPKCGSKRLLGFPYEHPRWFLCLECGAWTEEGKPIEW
jgi:ribosomal protein S27AE